MLGCRGVGGLIAAPALASVLQAGVQVIIVLETQLLAFLNSHPSTRCYSFEWQNSVWSIHKAFTTETI